MRFRWKEMPKGKLRIPGRPPVPDRMDRDRVVAGVAPRILQFSPDGGDGIYTTDDPWERAAIRQSVPWARKLLVVDEPVSVENLLPGYREYPRPGVQRPVTPPARPRSTGSLDALLKERLPYFAEPETFEDLLAVL